MQAAAQPSNDTSTDYQAPLAQLASTASSPKAKSKAKGRRKSSLRSTGKPAAATPQVRSGRAGQLQCHSASRALMCLTHGGLEASEPRSGLRPPPWHSWWLDSVPVVA